jgi:iron-sulfur cluster assembly protein
MRRLLAFLLGLIQVGCSRPATSTQEQSQKAKSQQSSRSFEQFQRKDIVSLTPAAADMIRQVQKQEGYDFVRAGVKQDGPTGFLYDLGFSVEPDADKDFLSESQGIRIVVDKRSAIYLDGATIDFTTDEQGQRGFKFHNPNAVKN